MRKHSVKLLLSINFMLIIAFIVSILQQSNKISILQSQKEQVEKDCNKLYSDYEKLSQEMEECKAVNEELAKQLDEQKRTVPEGGQPYAMPNRILATPTIGSGSCFREKLI